MKWYLWCILLLSALLVVTTYDESRSHQETPGTSEVTSLEPSSESSSEQSSESEYEKEVRRVIQEWSDRIGVPAPYVTFSYDEHYTEAYDRNGKLGRFRIWGSYFPATNTIIIRGEVDGTVIRHEYIHYLRDILGEEMSLKDDELEAYYLSENPIVSEFLLPL